MVDKKNNYLIITIPLFIDSDSCDGADLMCDPGLCLPVSLRCNGKVDCENSADELNCGEK